MWIVISWVAFVLLNCHHDTSVSGGEEGVYKFLNEITRISLTGLAGVEGGVSAPMATPLLKADNVMW